MDDLITLEMALNLSQKIMLDNSKDRSKFNVLLSKQTYEKFDTKELKEEINNLFNEYKEITYLYQFPSSLTASKFENKEHMLINNPIDTVGISVERKIDKQIWTTQFYYILLKVSSKLTWEEILYMTGTFFRNQTEDTLCEKMLMCRNTLRGIKKSCLVKMWIELKVLSEEYIYKIK